MASKYSISGHDLAFAAYLGLLRQEKITKPSEGQIYQWKFSMSDSEDNETCELMLVLSDEKEKNEEEYEPGSWRDPSIK